MTQWWALHISTKINLSILNSLEVITTQKCSNRFENHVKKWLFHIVLTISSKPQIIFEWGFLNWLVDILGFYLNKNFVKFKFKISEIWQFEVRSLVLWKIRFCVWNVDATGICTSRAACMHSWPRMHPHSFRTLYFHF